MRARAVVNVSPTRFGITYARGALANGWLNNRLTSGLSTPSALGGGVCASTTSAGPGAGRCAIVPRSSDARRIAADASRWSMPMVSGISAFCGPMLSVMRMFQPLRTLVPGAGNCDSTRPAGTVVE